MKVCPKCKRKLDKDCFSKNKDRKDGLQIYCKECCKLLRRNHYVLNKGRVIEWVKKRNQNEYKKWKDYKATLFCIKCGENHPACLEFHHKNPKDKELSLSQIVRRGWGKDRREKELSKCIVLCSNCHKKEHWKERNGDVVVKAPVA